MATTTTAPATTTTVAATTTTAPATTTTETPTATVPAPTGPIDKSIPILMGGGEGNWVLLGSWQVDHWARAFTDDGEPITPDIGGNPTFAISGLGFPQTSGVVGPNGLTCFDQFEGPSIDATLPRSEPPGSGFNAVALPSSWSLRPRPAAVIAGGVAAYEQLGIDAFADDPVDASQGRVAQIVVVDLDGDGDDEAIVSFERIEAPSTPGSPGDLAAILLVDTTTRASQTVLTNAVDVGAVVGTVVGDDSGEFFIPIIERYRVLDIADLNGDGRMEVVISSWTDESFSVIVYEYDGSTLNAVLANGCGP